jgi:hypothetical protein
VPSRQQKVGIRSALRAQGLILVLAVVPAAALVPKRPLLRSRVIGVVTTRHLKAELGERLDKIHMGAASAALENVVALGLPALRTALSLDSDQTTTVR